MQIDHLSHPSITGSVRMQVVSGIIVRLQLLPIDRVAQGCIKIDHRVEFFGRTDPGVDTCSGLLPLGCMEARAPEWRERRTNQLDATLMSTRCKLTISADETFR